MYLTHEKKRKQTKVIQQAGRSLVSCSVVIIVFAVLDVCDCGWFKLREKENVVKGYFNPGVT